MSAFAITPTSTAWGHEASDHAGQREPPEPGRPAHPQVLGDAGIGPYQTEASVREGFCHFSGALLQAQSPCLSPAPKALSPHRQGSLITKKQRFIYLK